MVAPALTRLEEALDLIERLGFAERVISVNLWNPTRIQLKDVADIEALPGEATRSTVISDDGEYAHVLKTLDGIEVIGVDFVRAERREACEVRG